MNMEFICPTNELKNALNKVQYAIPAKSTISILEGVLVEAVSDQIILTGYDQEMGIICRIPAEVKTTGSLVVPAKMFLNITSLLKDETVQIMLSAQDTLNIHSGNSHFELKGQSAESYSKLPSVKKENELTISQIDLKQMIKATEFAISKDEQRRNLNGALLKSYDNTYEMVAIDGFRLAMCKKTSAVPLPNLSFVIHGKTLKQLESMLKDEKQAVTLFTTQNHIQFVFDNVTMISRLIQGEFMPYQNLMTDEHLTKITLKTKDFQYLIRCAMTVTNNDNLKFPVKLKTDDQSTFHVIEDAGHTKFNDAIEADIDGESIDIDFNAVYFRDVLNVIEDEEMTIYFNGKVGPSFIRPVDGDHFGYLIMPLRR